MPVSFFLPMALYGPLWRGDGEVHGRSGNWSVRDRQVLRADAGNPVDRLRGDDALRTVVSTLQLPVAAADLPRGRRCGGGVVRRGLVFRIARIVETLEIRLDVIVHGVGEVREDRLAFGRRHQQVIGREIEAIGITPVVIRPEVGLFAFHTGVVVPLLSVTS